VKTGKLPPKLHPNTLRLADYLTTKVPPAPPAFSIPGTAGLQWPMYLNDRIGCCTEAAMAHHVQAQAATLGRSIVFPDSAIQAAYSEVSGYDPATGANDNGAVETDVLAQWQSEGVGGHKILAWVAVNHSNLLQINAACYWLAGLYLGLALPITAQAQTEQRQPWDVVPHAGPDAYPGSWGGHAVNATAYSPAGYEDITWGTTQQMTSRFLLEYCDEVYAAITDDLLDPATGKDFDGLNQAALLADAHAVAGR
jgi:hypothetical protein